VQRHNSLNFFYFGCKWSVGIAHHTFLKIFRTLVRVNLNKGIPLNEIFLSSALLSLTMVASTQEVAFSSPKADGYYRCSVYDPTGTPLNIRTKPGGKVIGTIVNGSRVGLAAREDSGKWR
jgi:hypothetical protein